MFVEIPRVMGVVVDNVSGDAKRFARTKTLEQIELAGVVFWSPNEQTLDNTQGLMWYRAWESAHLHPNVTHLLFFQYDGWVINGNAWDPSWLQYDYIGAPWPWQPEGYQVGNGGFSLRSVRMMRHIAENREKFPVTVRNTDGNLFPEDVLLCHGYRERLEGWGFRWAPTTIAEKFSVERGPWRTNTFGFHGIYNIPNVLTVAEFAAWKSSANNYIRNKVEWKELP